MKFLLTPIVMLLGLARLAVPAYAAPIELCGGPDQDRSYILAITGKSGPFAFLSHEHAILGTQWSAKIVYDPDQPGNSSVKIQLNTPSLVIDSALGRKLAKFHASGPKASDLPGLQKKMLGPKFLDAERFPQMEFNSHSVSSYVSNLLYIHGQMTIRDRSNPFTVPVRMRKIDPKSYQFSGEYTIKQTDYGITPESVMGLFKVTDEVKLRFDILGSASSCGD